MDQIKIGKFIASCRKEQGMTQAVLAEKLGISDRAVSKWETGKSLPVWLRIVLIVFALVIIFTVAFIAVGIEQKAGYYECQNCHLRYVPTYWQTNLAMHMGRTRYMKCPECGKRSWQKKVLTKEE